MARTDDEGVLMTNAQREALEMVNLMAKMVRKTSPETADELHRMLIRERRQHAIEHDEAANAH